MTTSKRRSTKQRQGYERRKPLEDQSDLLEIDWASGVRLIPKLEDQDPDHPPMRRVHRATDYIQDQMRYEARLRSMQFPEYVDEE